MHHLHMHVSVSTAFERMDIIRHFYDSSPSRQLHSFASSPTVSPFNPLDVSQREKKGGGARNDNSILSANIRVHPHGCLSSNYVCVVLNMETEITVHASPLIINYDP
jgi:hypothetical protein